MTLIALSRYVSFHAKGDAVFAWHGLTGDVAEMSRDGLVKLSPGGCAVTEAGRPFLRNICMAFDARLQRKDAGARLFSRTI